MSNAAEFSANQIPVRLTTLSDSPARAELAQGYAAALQRHADAPLLPALDHNQLNLFWFYQAVDRAIQGHNLAQELAQAQALTAAYQRCIQEGFDSSSCAARIDPTQQR